MRPYGRPVLAAVVAAVATSTVVLKAWTADSPAPGDSGGTVVAEGQVVGGPLGSGAVAADGVAATAAAATVAAATAVAATSAAANAVMEATPSSSNGNGGSYGGNRGAAAEAGGA